MKKFYAVKEGKIPGIYLTWEECKNQVHGYSGAVYKSFSTREEAINFINNNNKISSDAEAIAYTDGSYNIKDGRFSYGVVIFYKGQKLTFSESFFDEEMSEMRNVAGEIKGAEFAFQFCIDNNISTLELLYDYEGIEKWCTGVWRRNKKGTIAYHEYYNSIKDKLKVTFTKVKGHSGNIYNDEADKLAKEALGIK